MKFFLHLITRAPQLLPPLFIGVNFALFVLIPICFWDYRFGTMQKALEGLATSNRVTLSFLLVAIALLGIAVIEVANWSFDFLEKHFRWYSKLDRTGESLRFTQHTLRLVQSFASRFLYSGVDDVKQYIPLYDSALRRMATQASVDPSTLSIAAKVALLNAFSSDFSAKTLTRADWRRDLLRGMVFLNLAIFLLWVVRAFTFGADLTVIGWISAGAASAAYLLIQSKRASAECTNEVLSIIVRNAIHAQR